MKEIAFQSRFQPNRGVLQTATVVLSTCLWDSTRLSRQPRVACYSIHVQGAYSAGELGACSGRIGAMSLRGTIFLLWFHLLSTARMYRSMIYFLSFEV